MYHLHVPSSWTRCPRTNYKDQIQDWVKLPDSRAMFMYYVHAHTKNKVQVQGTITRTKYKNQVQWVGSRTSFMDQVHIPDSWTVLKDQVKDWVPWRMTEDYFSFYLSKLISTYEAACLRIYTMHTYMKFEYLVSCKDQVWRYPYFGDTVKSCKLGLSHLSYLYCQRYLCRKNICRCIHSNKIRTKWPRN